MKFTVHIFIFLFLTFSQSFSTGGQQNDESPCCYWGSRAIGWMREKTGTRPAPLPPTVEEPIPSIDKQPRDKQSSGTYDITPCTSDFDDEKKSNYLDEKQPSSNASEHDDEHDSIHSFSEELLEEMALKAKLHIKELGLMGTYILRKINSDNKFSSSLMEMWDLVIKTSVEDKVDERFIDNLQLYCGIEIGKLLFNIVEAKIKAKGIFYAPLERADLYKKELATKEPIYKNSIHAYIAIKKELEARHRIQAGLKDLTTGDIQETQC